MRARAAGLVMAVVTFFPTVAAGQEGGATASATDVTREDINTVLKSMGESIDRHLKVVDISIGNVAVGILHSDGDNDSDGAPRGIIHTKVSEMCVMLTGGGTFLTGGEVVNATEPSRRGGVMGPTFSGKSRNGVIREISAGDVVVIPAEVLHGLTLIPDKV